MQRPIVKSNKITCKTNRSYTRCLIKNSSNSSKLQLIAEEMGNKSYLIDGPEDINPLWLDEVSSVGITAWASGPEELIVQVIEYLTSLGGTFEKELRIIEEKWHSHIP